MYNIIAIRETEEWEQIPLFKHVKGRKILARIEEKVEQLIQPDITALGYELYDVVYEKEGKDFYLRIYIDSPKGIDLNDCEKVNNAITDKLDEADYIKEMYFLEVSSCGLERILRKEKHLEEQKGHEIEVKLYKPIEKKKQYEGILKEFNAEKLVLQEQENIIELERKNISQIKTIYHWEE